MVTPLTNQSINRTIDRSINQSSDQSINQSINQSIIPPQLCECNAQLFFLNQRNRYSVLVQSRPVGLVRYDLPRSGTENPLCFSAARLLPHQVLRFSRISCFLGAAVEMGKFKFRPGLGKRFGGRVTVGTGGLWTKTAGGGCALIQNVDNAENITRNPLTTRRSHPKPSVFNNMPQPPAVSAVHQNRLNKRNFLHQSGTFHCTIDWLIDGLIE